MAITKMSVSEYIDYRKKRKNTISTQAVTKQLRKGKLPPGIIYHEMYGGTYILHVHIEELDKWLVVINKLCKLQGKQLHE